LAVVGEQANGSSTATSENNDTTGKWVFGQFFSAELSWSLCLFFFVVHPQKRKYALSIDMRSCPVRTLNIGHFQGHC
jgi:hypothetical protein